MKTVVGLYDSIATAQQVVEALVNSGFDRDRISIVANNATGEYATDRVARTDADDVSAGEGAGIGALEGGVLGLLAGLGLMAIPGIGPALAAGPLIGALIGAGTGAVTGGLVAGLIDTGIPETEAGYYAEGVRRGGTLVSVQADDTRANEAAAIMNRFGPINVEEHAANWQQSGFNRFDTNAKPLTAEEIKRERERFRATAPTARTDTTTTTKRTETTTTPANKKGEVTVPIVQEELQVGKRAVEQGGVRIHTRVEEKPVQEQVTLREEHVTVERRPADRPASEADLKRIKEGTLEVTERSEQAVVNKQARVVEEVVVGKEVDQRTETVRETVKRTDVDVEQMPAGARTQATSFESFDTDFRSNFTTTYGTRGQTYERYVPAYRYGYTLATDERYRGRDWAAIEADARRSWNTSQGPWEDFKDAVRYAWDKVRGVR